jgi:hypothetical protein
MGNQIYFKIAGKKKIDRRVEPPDTFLDILELLPFFHQNVLNFNTIILYLKNY